MSDSQSSRSPEHLPIIESLEGRQLLSASVHHGHTEAVHATVKHKHTKAAKSHHSKAAASTSDTTSSTGSSTGGVADPIGFRGRVEDTITFSQAPSAVQSGLTALASTDGQATPTTDQTVNLGNRNGVETYSLHYTTTGTTTSITVDQDGNPVTQPTESTTTFADLTSSDSAAATEISAIATALNLTAPADTTTINVSTTAAGAATYSVHLPWASTSSSTANTSAVGGPIIFAGQTISVDASGNPVGNQRLPFSVLPTGIQSSINQNVPTGATALASDSTQDVTIRTVDGLVLYSTTFTSSGTTTTVTVTADGTPTSLPTQTTADFSTIPSAAQNELQTLATADGVTTAISSTQSVDVYTESTGTVIYSVSLSNPASTADSTSAVPITSTITIAVDAAGNPTVPPGNGGFGFGGGGFGGGGWGHGPVPVAPISA